MPNTIFWKNKKKMFLTIFGMMVLAVGIGLIYAPKAEATGSSWNYLHVKIDADISDPDGMGPFSAGNRDGSCGALENCFQLWQFHGFDLPYPHGGNLASGVCRDTGSGDGICNGPPAPANYHCGIWLVEEWDTARDTVALLWTKKGNKLSKGGTSIWNDLTINNTVPSNIFLDRGLDVSDPNANTASDLCWDANIDTMVPFPIPIPPGLLFCDLSDGSWDVENTAKATYGTVDQIGGTEDKDLSDSVATTYRPDVDILCDGTKSWKTCEANSCASVVTVNDWACDGTTKVWTPCVAPQVCNITTGACEAPGVCVSDNCNNNCPAFCGPADDPDCTFLGCCGDGACGAGETNAICPGDCFCGDGVCDAGETPATCLVDCSPIAICPADTGDCDEDASTGPSGCEADLFMDENNCGHCGIKCNGICQNGVCVSPKGGVVPCGRISDNCDTSWDEKAPCNSCHSIILAKNIIDYLVEIVGLITILFIIIGGLISVTSSGGSSGLTTAKTAISKSVLGFVFVFVAWVIINVMMVIFGFIDPLGDGKWNVIDCDAPTATCSFSCGDGTVQPPEECERTETLADFQARTGGTMAEWTEMKGKCSFGCTYKCIGDPLENKIGEGCYNPIDGTGNLCQKGKYTCAVDSNTVQCINIFNNPAYSWDPDFLGFDLYDYCCVNNSAEFADGSINGVPFTIAKAAPSDIMPTGGASLACWQGVCPLDTGTSYFAPTLSGYLGGFRCDNICKNIGKICVGVGLTDPAVDSCVYIKHDEGSTPGGCDNDGKAAVSMVLPANQASTNCNAWFGMFLYSNYNNSGQHWSTGYDKYVYHCEKYSPDTYWETYSPASYDFNDVPAGSEGVCKPLPPDTCEFHGFDITETACYCL